MDLGGARFLVLGRPGAGEHRQRLMERPAQHLAAERRGALDRPAEVIQSTLPARRIGTDRAVRRIGQDRDRGAAEPVVADGAANLLEMGDTALEQRDLDAVVAGGLELLEQRKMRRVDVRRPQQEIEPRLHAPDP